MSRPFHETVARRWRHVRLASQAAVGAVVGSGLALVLGAAPSLHLVAIAAGAAAGAAWPVRGDERRALRWVGERSGLAYETAWDHARDAVAAGGADTAAALRAAVAVQGRLSVRDLRPPPVSAWWLPLLTLAIGMWAWALLVTPGGPGAAWTPAAGASPPGPETSGAASSDPLLPEEAEDAPVPPTEPDAAPGAEPGADDGASAAGATGGGSQGAAAERDALERFLDNLRERPELTEEEQRAADAALAEPSDEEGDGEPDEGASARPGDTGPDAERAPAGDREQGPGEGDGEEGPGDGDAEGPAEVGDDAGTAEGEEGEEGDEATAAGADDAGVPGEEGGETEGAPGDEPAGGPDAGDEDGAGMGVGVEDVGGEGVDPTAVAPEALPSILGPGPEQAVGGVQLPGSPPADDVFPAGAAGTEYRRAVERALGEGEVPVPYQEVIRNYFR